MDDFRFTPSTFAVSLPYWVADNTTTPKGFWIKVSTLTAGLNTIYMYYANSNATNGNSYTNTATTSSISYSYQGDSGLLGEWRMENNWNDSSGNGNNGTGYGGVVFTTSRRFGTYAGNFDGTDDYVDVGAFTDYNSSAERTLESWIYPTELKRSPIVDKYNHGIEYQLDGTIKLWIRDTSGNWPLAVTPYANAYDNWYHVVGVYKANNYLKIYVNGALGQTVDLTTAIDGSYTPSNLFIGKTDHVGGVYFKGRLDEARVYNRALTETEIGAHYLGRQYISTDPMVTSVSSEEGAFFSTGTYKSPVIDNSSKVVISSISWNPTTQPTSTQLAVSIRISKESFAADSPTPAWHQVSNNSNPGIVGRYVQYSSTFTTSVTTSTPRLEDIAITYKPAKPWKETSVVRTGSSSHGFYGGDDWTWQVPVKGGTLVTISAYIRYNTEYSGGTYDKPKLTLLGLGINESISATSSAENSWELRQLSGTPSADGILTLKAEGFSPNPGGKFYVDDILINQ